MTKPRPPVDPDMVGLPMYPLNYPKLKKVFAAESGSEIQDDSLAALLRKIHERTPFEFGNCYSNAEKIVQNANLNGMKGLTTYAGWLLFDSNRERPVHHAWVVRGQDQIIDMGFLRQQTTLAEVVMPQVDEQGKEAEKAGKLLEFNIAWRIAWARQLRPLEIGDILTNRVYGKVPPLVTYVGCPCDAETATTIYRRWHKIHGTKTGDVAPGESSMSQEITRLIEKGAPDSDIMNYYLNRENAHDPEAVREPGTDGAAGEGAPEPRL